MKGRVTKQTPLNKGKTPYERKLKNQPIPRKGKSDAKTRSK